MPEDKTPAEDARPSRVETHTVFDNPFAEPDPKPEPDPALPDDDMADDEPDDDMAEPEDEPKPASMSMTKAELLERVTHLEAELKKAELLERIQELEDDTDDEPATEAAAARALSHENRTVTLNGTTYTWVEGAEDTVPAEAVAVYQRARAAGGL